MLPYPKITKIPEEPDAVADESLWNTRYAEMDSNFENLDGRSEAIEMQLADFDLRLEPLESLPDDVAATIADVEALKPVSGVATILNRGIQLGGFISKSSTATRNVSISRAMVFLHGSLFHFENGANAAVIPSNPTGQEATATVYLYLDGQDIPQVNCTNLDEDPPADSLQLYKAKIPAGNDENSDPYLDSVELAGIHRVEPGWPTIQQSPIEFHPEFLGQIYEPYQFDFEVLSPNISKNDFVAERKPTEINGISTTYVVLRYLGSFDNAKIRWTVRAADAVGEE